MLSILPGAGTINRVLLVSQFSPNCTEQKSTVERQLYVSNNLPRAHHGDWAEPTNFDQLRIKTETQLVQLINAELDLGIHDARQALNSADTWAVAEEWHGRATRAYAKVARLLPLVVEITDEERRRVESRLVRLQGMLEALSTIGSTPTPAENEIAALARAVWEARGCPEGLPEDDWFRAERALKNRRDANAVCFVG